jgi:hypothetical protein
MGKKNKKTKKIKKGKPLKNILDKRIKIPKKIRLAIIGIIVIFLLINLLNLNAAYEKPTTKYNTYTKYSYGQKGEFDYLVYLVNNSLYEKDVLGSEIGEYFKLLIDHITGSFKYSISCSKPIVVYGNYSLEAQISTDIWTKSYILQKDEFNSNTFNIDFPIDYAYYESILNEINSETGITAPNPLLVITCNIESSVKTTDNENIPISNFYPALTVSLTGKTVEISNDTVNQISGVKTGREEIFLPEVVDERETLLLYSEIILIVLILFVVLTRDYKKKIDEVEKQVNKIKKKYGEWMVETEFTPDIKDKNIIKLKSIEDLVKTSEELGKTFLYSKSKYSSDHIFYVIDDQTWYEFRIKQNKIN